MCLLSLHMFVWKEFELQNVGSDLLGALGPRHRYLSFGEGTQERPREELRNAPLGLSVSNLREKGTRIRGKPLKRGGTGGWWDSRGWGRNREPHSSCTVAWVLGLFLFIAFWGLQVLYPTPALLFLNSAFSLCSSIFDRKKKKAK